MSSCDIDEQVNDVNVKNSTLASYGNFLDFKPSKIQLQELKWKYTTRRRSLPVTDSEKNGFSEESLVKQRNRRKSESDLDLDLDTYNVNALQTEISKLSKKNSKKYRKCRKHKCKNDIKKDKIRKLKRMKLQDLVYLLIEDLDKIKKIEDSEFYGQELLDVVNDLSERLKPRLIAKEKLLTDYFISGDDIKKLLKTKNKNNNFSKGDLKTFLFSLIESDKSLFKSSTDIDEVPLEKVLQILALAQFFKIIHNESFLKANLYFDFIINYINEQKHFSKSIKKLSNHQNSSSNDIFSETSFKSHLQKLFKSKKITAKEETYIKFYRSQIKKDEKLFKICKHIIKKENSDSKKESTSNGHSNTSKENVSYKKNKCKANGEPEKNSSDMENKKPKINAFELMMDARYKSIGRNSPGKEREPIVEDEDSKNEIKEKLHKRKLFLTEWANEKTNVIEKKIKEKAREEYIENVLEKRSKRLKLMLKINMTDSKAESEEIADNVDGNQSITCTKVSNDVEINTPSRWNLRIRPPKKSDLLDDTENEKDIDLVCVDDDIIKRKKPTRHHKIVNEKIEKRTPIKLAPLFTKKTVCKPKIDPMVLEARRKFLHSGMPEVIVKKEEKTFFEPEYETFPITSHITQRPTKENSAENNFWSLPKPVFTKPLLPLDLNLASPELNFNHDLASINKSTIEPSKYSITTPEKLLQQKSILKEMKNTNSSFPFFAIYRQFKEKLERTDLNINNLNGKTDDGNLIDPSYMLWTEKYKPDSMQCIIGNSPCVIELKKWLENWIADQEKKGIKSSNSDTSDSDTKDSCSMKPSTLVLVGPSGIGKTASVYALAKESGMKVLEINASTQRTGKKLLNAIQEATQSHRVTKTLTGEFTEEKQNKITNSQEKNSDDSMSLILIEDIDLVFIETDDGFLSALNSLLISSKRPFILTSSNPESKITQKYSQQYMTLEFKPISTKVLVPWFKTLCLAEGLMVSEEKVFQLLNINKSDIRKTMLDLQFWTRCCGGRTNYIVKYGQNGTEEDYSKYTLTINDEYKVKGSMHAVNIWKNIPLLESTESVNALFNGGNKENKIETDVLENQKIGIVTNNRKFYDEQNKIIDSLAEIYDSLSISEVFNNCYEPNLLDNPVSNAWSVNFTNFGNSLSLKDNKSIYSSCLENLNEINSVMLDLLTNSILNKFDCNESKISSNTNSVIDEIRYQKKIHAPNTIVFNAMPLHSLLPTINYTDYLFGLRTINRAEVDRAATNTKRRNRFCHYLKTLGINFTDQQSEIFNNCFVNIDKHRIWEL